MAAPVRYTATGLWQLDDWLPAAIAQLKETYATAKRIAVANRDQELVETLATLEQRRKDLVGDLFQDQWAINAHVHFNDWAQLSSSEFRPIADAISKLEQLIRCDSCHDIPAVTPRSNRPEVYSCVCGDTSWRLKA